MKKLLTLVLGVVMLVAFAGLGVAQQKGVEKSQATGVEKKQPATPPSPARAVARVCSNCYACKCDTGSAGCLCGSTITNIDNNTKTISVRRKDGTIHRLDASKLTTPPNVGQTVHVQYADVGGKPVVQSVAVCTGGYWWTITWGGMTQGGPCSVEGATK
jgi:hypothetical protein